MRISDWSSDVCSSDPAQPSGNTIAYSQFLDKVEEGTVKEVNVAGEVITGTLKDDSAFRTYAIQDPQLTDRLRKAGVTITARPEESPSIWMIMLYNSLPFLLFRSEEHTSELQSLMRISYAVFCLKKKK